MAPLYAARADVETYIEGWVTDDAAALDRLIERAERDVDALFPLLPIITTGTYAGRRFDPTTLATYERQALINCVCAQAEFRFTKGEELLAGGVPRVQSRVKGPDFEVQYADAGGTLAAAGSGRYSPRLDTEILPLDPYRRSGGARAYT